MTHAESQDLLLELVYGELDEARAREVHLHLAGCEECRKEKAAIDQTRAAAAPLRESDEPPAGFDERVMRAARAQAQLEHDGNIGEVVEVTGSVKPLGIEPADIDAMATVKARSAARRRPRWMAPAAVGGSVAAAAALALVVGSMLQTRESAPLEEQARYEIKVKPAAEPPAASPPPAAQAQLPAAQAQPPAAQAQLPAPEPAAQPQPAAPPAAAPPAHKRARAAEGSGGDAPPQKKSLAREERAQRKTASPGGVPAAAEAAPRTADESSGSPPAAKAELRAARAAPAPAPSAANQGSGMSGAALPPAAGAVSSTAQPKPPAERRMQAAVAAREPDDALLARADAEKPEALEQRARDLRHAGDYAGAAALYRQAALLQRQQGAAGSVAAWDLAHAVECLAAAGQFDEARKVRDEINSAYPGEEDARSASTRVLRRVEPAAPAAKSAPQAPADLAPVQR